MKANKLRQMQDRLENRLQTIVDNIDPSMVKEWRNHPCTQALEAYLDMVTLYNAMAWSEGAYIDESAEKTLMLNNQGLGEIQRTIDISEFIETFQVGEVIDDA